MTKLSKKRPASKTSFPNSKLLAEIIDRVRRGRRFLVTTHQGPDGDALGSALALAAGLRKLGKTVKLYNQDEPPSYLQFLPSIRQFTHVLGEKERYDAAFIVDCADLHRVGDVFKNHLGLGIKIVVDHHAKSGLAGDLNFVDVRAASSGMVVLQILKALRVKLDPKIATNIYATIVTDTGNFRYSNVNERVLEAAREMVLAGAVPWKVSRELYERHPKERFKLLPKVMETLRLFFDDRVALIRLSRQMLQEAAARRDMAEDFVEFPRSIDTVEVAAFLREADDGRIKVSLRSKEYLDVSRIAQKFGGGGHLRAAGCTFEAAEGWEGAINRLLEAIQPQLKA